MSTTRSWPPAAQVEEQAWHVAELRPGDLIFCSKLPGADGVERVNQIANQQWRHVGALVEHEGELHVVETQLDTFGTRSLAAFFGDYDRFGAVRLGLPQELIDLATARMYGRLGDPNIYAADDLVLAGLSCLTRRGIFVNNRPQVRAALAAAAASASEARTRGGVASFTCSNFLYWAYLDADGACAVHFDRWRSATTWPPRLATIDELLSDEGVALDDVYGDATLLDLFEITQLVDRTANPVIPGVDQWGEIIRVLVGFVAGYVWGEAPDRLHAHGRWVTPGDFWDSSSVARRGQILIPTE